jgi:hypothetical protein
VVLIPSIFTSSSRIEGVDSTAPKVYGKEKLVIEKEEGEMNEYLFELPLQDQLVCSE